MPDPTKKYPVKDPKERRDTKSGTIKQVSDDTGKKLYHKDPATGKMVEYNATRYVDAYRKKTEAPPKPEAHSTKSFDNSKDLPSGKYMDEIFNHTTGKGKHSYKSKAVFK